MRRVFASAVVVCLMAMSSWASACDLACSLPRFHSGCQPGGSAVSEAASDMDMSNMAMPLHSPAPNAELLGSVHLHANSCLNGPCKETSISAVSKSAAQHPVQERLFVSSERPTALISNVLVSWPTPKFEAPDLQPFDPLLVSLRI